MAWRFRKRIRLIPGVYLNLSTKGISTTIGPRGLSLNIGSKGSYLNTGIPGTGLYNRISLEGPKKVAEGDALDKIEYNLDHILNHYSDGATEIKSDSIGHLTSAGLKDLKNTIIAAHREYSEIDNSLAEKRAIHVSTSTRIAKLRRSLFRFLFRKKIARLESELQELQDEIDELAQQLTLSSVELNIQHDDAFEDLYKNLENAYQLISNCSKIWDITATKNINRIQQRSLANTEVNRAEVKSLLQPSGLIVTETTPLRLMNKNGGDLYFYPGFVIVHEQAYNFAIVDYSEFDVEFIDTQFVESDPVPKDAQIIGQTWAKVNKDGSRDKRFNGNYQIPIARYGRINFKSATGMNESYLFSNFKYALLFYQSTREYIEAIKSANNLLSQFN